MKYDVDLQRLHHKRGKLTQASCVSAKSDGGIKRSEKERLGGDSEKDRQTQ